MENIRPLNKRILKKFLDLLERGFDLETCLKRFPEDYNKLKDYAEMIDSFNDLKPVNADEGFIKQNLKEVYARARIENLVDQNRTSKKDLLLIRLRPAYLKPLVVFLSVFVFFSFSFAGTVYASAETVPGQTLYSVKRVSESIQIAFIPYGKEGNLHFKFLNRRLNEADVLFKKSDEADLCYFENLLTDIDFSYKKCLEHDCKGLNDGGKMKGRIDQFRNDYDIKCRMQGTEKGKQDGPNTNGNPEQKNSDSEEQQNNLQSANTSFESSTSASCPSGQATGQAGSCQDSDYVGPGKSAGEGAQKGQTSDSKKH